MIGSTRIRAQLHIMAGGLPRPFWVLWCGILINRMGTFVVPFLAIYLTQVRGFSIAQAGMVASLYGVGSSIAAPVGGYLADHLGRRIVMVGALTLGGACMIGLGFAHGLATIAPATFVVALVSDMYRPGVQAALSDIVPPRDRVRAFGLIYWVINLGFAIGLLLAGVISTISYVLLFVGDGATSIIFGLIVWRAIPETRPAPAPHSAEQPRRSVLAEFFAPYRDGTYMAFIGLAIMSAVLFMQHTLALPLDMMAHGVSKPVFGAVIALNGILIVLVQPFLGPFLTRFPRSRVLATGGALLAVGFGLNAFVHVAPLYALGVAIWTIGEILVLPTSNAVVADLAPAALRGRYQGAYSLSFGLALIVAPTVGSLVMQHFGARTLWLGAFALGLLTMLGQLALERPLERARRARMAEH